MVATVIPTVSTIRAPSSSAAVVGRPVTAEALSARAGDFPWALFEATGFEAKPGQTQVFVDSEDKPVIAVGLGPAHRLNLDDFREAGGALARAARNYSSLASSVLDVFDGAEADLQGVDRLLAIRAHVEGLILGAYVNGMYKSDRKKSAIKKIGVVAVGTGAKNAAVEGSALAAATWWARDMVNEPGGSLTPTVFAQRVKALAADKKLKYKVMDLAAIKKAKLGGLLGVSRGSAQPPKLVELEYRPSGKSKAHIVLVGKGITFDAGGLSIKSAGQMATMKYDMGGGAAVIAAMAALADLAPPFRVRAIVPMTDNMLGPDAMRPGDVVTARNGKTIEVLNTDAEGRLILADGLSLASEAKPDVIIDAATLTGAAKMALGPSHAALMGNNSELLAQIEAAGKATGELVWPMPMPPEYRSSLDSTIADLKNVGASLGSAAIAALFLEEFVAEGIPWAHIDIAGTAFTDSSTALQPKGATGFGARLLAQTVLDLNPKALLS